MPCLKSHKPSRSHSLANTRAKHRIDSSIDSLDFLCFFRVSQTHTKSSLVMVQPNLIKLSSSERLNVTCMGTSVQLGCMTTYCP